MLHVNGYQLAKDQKYQDDGKKASKEEVENNNGLIMIKDREGYWIEQSDMLSKYMRRPSELESMSSSQFAKMYTTAGIKLRTEENEADEVSEEETLEINVDKENQKNTLDFIATGNDILIRLPEFIRLQDPLPREPRMMRKRKKPAVLHFLLCMIKFTLTRFKETLSF